MDEILRRLTASATNRVRDVEGLLSLLRGTSAYARALAEAGVEEYLDASGRPQVSRPREETLREFVGFDDLTIDELRVLAHEVNRKLQHPDVEAWRARMRWARRQIDELAQEVTRLEAWIRGMQTQVLGAEPLIEHTEASAEAVRARVRALELDLLVARARAESWTVTLDDAMSRVEAWLRGRGERLDPQEMGSGELLEFLRRAWPGHAIEGERNAVIWGMRAERAASRGDAAEHDRALAQVAAWCAGIDGRSGSGTP
jgi:hypothetical protein